MSLLQVYILVEFVDSTQMIKKDHSIFLIKIGNYFLMNPDDGVIFTSSQDLTM